MADSAPKAEHFIVVLHLPEHATTIGTGEGRRVRLSHFALLQLELSLPRRLFSRFLHLRSSLGKRGFPQLLVEESADFDRWHLVINVTGSDRTSRHVRVLGSARFLDYRQAAPSL